MLDVMRKIQTDNELKDAAEHVMYEAVMLISCAQVLSEFHSMPLTTSPTIVMMVGENVQTVVVGSAESETRKSMALEAFLLHFRNLRGFLCPSLQSTRDDDIIASDCLRKTTLMDEGDATKLGADKPRIDKMLAHLSYSRGQFISSANNEWDAGKMLKSICEELIPFIEVNGGLVLYHSCPRR